MNLGRRRARLLVSSPVGSRHNALTAGGSMTASGMKIRRRDGDTIRRLIQPWQSRAFAYYDLLGEIKFASQFYSRALGNLALFAAEVVEGEPEPVETQNPEAVAALARIQDPGGGLGVRSGLLASYGRLMFITGECYLFVSKDEDGQEQWEVLSPDELRVIGSGTYLRYKAPSLIVEEYREPKDEDFVPVDDREAVAYRLWRRHPRYSFLADSTMQGVLDLCEELVLLTQAVRARARSRLAGAGMLLVAEEISPAPLEPAPDEDPEEDVFLAKLIEAMMQPIVDEGTASSVVPIVVRAPFEQIEKGIRHIQLVDPVQLYPETGLRKECVERIAIGLDMPPEVLTGLTDANHWSAWAVDEQTWKSHLQPVAQQLVDDLTNAYFRPYLRDAGVRDWQRYCIAYDATEIINHPDRSKDAKDLYGHRAIGKKALRAANGFLDEDAPTTDELAEMIGVAVRDSSLAWDGVPSVKAGGLEPEPGVIVKPGDQAAGEEGAATGGEVEPGPAKSDDRGVGQAPGVVAAARVAGAAELALLRAREAAGNRLRSYARRDPDIARSIEGLRTGQIAAFLGREKVRALKAPAERELVAGVRDLIVDALRLFGITDQATVDFVVESVERHAARTLYDERPAPISLNLPSTLA